MHERLPSNPDLRPDSRPSLADSLMRARTLLDGRYRLDALIRRSATATIHVAMHRNGSTAWLKLPFSAAHAELLARESTIANSLASPLVVRDDGTTRDGVPYLVLDPPEAESVAALRARAKAGHRLPLAHVMTAGDALARVVAALHGLGYVTGGLEDEDVLLFANGDAALLDLHAATAATPAGITTDVKHLLRVLSRLVSDVADTASAPQTRAAIAGALAAAYPDVTMLQAAWRAASPEPIQLPARTRPGGFADVPSAPALAAPSTPQSMSVDEETKRDADGSVIGYLRSGAAVPSIARPAGPHERAVMYDPLSKVPELPRLVHATSRAAEPGARSSMSRTLVAASIALPLLAVLSGAAFLMSSSGASPRRAPAATALKSAAGTQTAPAVKASPPAASMIAAEAEPPAGAVQAPVAVAGEAPVAAADPDDELQLNAVLRTDGAPPDRDVFVDGKRVGKTPLHVSVPCGRHTLQMVAGAPKQPVELPCGGERIVRYDAKGHWSLKAE